MLTTSSSHSMMLPPSPPSLHQCDNSAEDLKKGQFFIVLAVVPAPEDTECYCARSGDIYRRGWLIRYNNTRPMVAIAARPVGVCLELCMTGERQPITFTEDVFEDIYRICIKTL
ncbi:hypothetical protein B0H10DRAFT_2208936 [Mycena sp. CBHHK59/15]|nr:hypothetical protein B0H10DRAFT_2208936 [Mycena sp. CBHHK59/15]